MDATDRIRDQIRSHPVFIYMKGTPQFPMCGFSSRTVQAIKEIGADFGYVDVLREPEIRAALPRFSDWPTFPQVFVDGEFVGGCDITLELAASGELRRLVESVVARP